MPKTQEQLINIWFKVWQIPGWLRLLEKTGDYTQEEISILENVDEEALKCANELEDEFFEFTKKYRTSLEEFKKELPADEIKELRLKFLDYKIDRLNRLVESIWKKYEESITTDVPYWLRKAVLDINNPDRIEGVIRHLSVEKHLLEHPDDINKINRVTPEEIAHALNFPFDQLLKFNKMGFALCPFHPEKTPSFHFIKRLNRGHCFGCQWHGDVINLLMDRDHLDFRAAVRNLLTFLKY